MVIKKIADIVGPGHKVDLKAYDLLILVEIHQVRRSPPKGLACREGRVFGRRSRG